MTKLLTQLNTFLVQQMDNHVHLKVYHEKLWIYNSFLFNLALNIY